MLFSIIPNVFGNTLDYSIMFVNSDEQCSSRNYDALSFYETITDQYLNKYGISHSLNDSTCITLDKLETNILKTKSSDLSIIVLDSSSALNYLFETNELGHWQYKGASGRNQIIFGSFTPFTESDTGAWILSHELSHFALHYKGQPDSIYGDWVHQIQAEADTCINENLSLNQCSNLWTIVSAPSGKDIKVMKIYDEYDSQQNYLNNNQLNIQPTPRVYAESEYDSSDFWKCRNYVNTEKYSQAITCYDKIIDDIPTDNPDYASALRDLARSYHKIGDYETSIEYYEDILDLKPNDFSSIVGLCYVYYDAGDYESAVQYGELAISMKPNDAGATICYDYSESKLQSSQPAPQTQAPPKPQPPANRNNGVNGDEIDNLFNKGGEMLDKEKYWDAIYYYDKALLKDPNNLSALINKGFALDSLGKHEDAIIFYDKALLIDPNDVDALNNKGVALERLGKYKEALFYYEKALEVDPNYSLARENKESVLQELTDAKSKQGGCLVATATYGSELAPQVQQLRELRDNSLLQTKSGTSFMNSFNQFYYSFSPTVADWERENPAFKEFVKISLTPMISSLSILNYVNMDSEISVLGYGISIILLNVGMYFVAPTLIVMRVKSKVLK
jgi:tetratricopeptide (TPR) repeat protein